MKKSKFQISALVLDAIADSQKISENEKIHLLKYVGYMTFSEQQELITLV